MIIYKVLNKINNKCYIGQTSRSLIIRKKELEKNSRKKWTVYNIDGRQEIIKVMSIWCRENDISVSTIRRTLKTGKYCRQGWMIKNYE